MQGVYNISLLLLRSQVKIAKFQDIKQQYLQEISENP
jgi:hypothetical protein